LLLLDWEAEVKDVLSGTNTLPIFDRFNFTNGSIHDDSNILQLRRKSSEGTIEATDAQGDNIYYEMSVNGNLTRTINGNNFSIVPTPSDSTADVEDLGDVIVRVCDEQNFDSGTGTCINYNEKVFAYGEINPVQEDIELSFNKDLYGYDSTLGWIYYYNSKHTSTSTDTSLDKIEIKVSDGYAYTDDYSENNPTETTDVLYNPTPEGDGWIEGDAYNLYGDHRTLRKNFATYSKTGFEEMTDAKLITDGKTLTTTGSPSEGVFRKDYPLVFQANKDCPYKDGNNTVILDDPVNYAGIIDGRIAVIDYNHPLNWHKMKSCLTHVSGGFLPAPPKPTGDSSNEVQSYIDNGYLRE
jgi:hypothetical protein